jgi:hypothetical protein
MRMQEPTLHIVFDRHGAETLAKDIWVMSRPDRIALLEDDLSYGPIAPPDPLARWAWAKREFRLRPHEKRRFVKAADFWKAALSNADRRIVWMTRQHGDEYAGFLEFVSRLDDESPCDVVDLTELEIECRLPGHRVVRRLPSLGSLQPWQVLQNELWDTAVPLTPKLRPRHRRTWEKLRAENAALRLLKRRKFVSAPITVFDELLLSCCDSRFHKCARVISHTLEKLHDDKIDIGWEVLAGRLRQFVLEGRLEGAGTMSRMTHSEVRLPARGR